MPDRAKKTEISATQVRVPTAAKDWDDWSAGDYIFMAFIYALQYYTSNDDRDYRTVYTIAERDLQIILNVPAYSIDPDNYLARIRRLFRIGYYPGYYTVQWRPELWEWRKDGSRQIKMKCEFISIRHQKMTEIWYYLMARLYTPGLYIEDEMTEQELQSYYSVPLLNRTEARSLSLRNDYWRKDRRLNVL